MKKILFYIPALVFTVLYALVVFAGVGALQPLVYVWLLLLWGAGVLLSKSHAWGGLLGIIPGVYFIYLSTQSNGQVLNIELPFGVVLLLYYAICMLYVFKKNHAKRIL